MELNEKAFARQKFRSSRGRGRAGRGGAHRGGQYTGLARGEPHRELDSNAYRYEDDAEEEGVMAPKSQGADLETLIEDADVQFNHSFYRFRAQLHDITEEVPPLGATRPEQLLAIDLEALAASLSALPLHTLLGLEPQFLAEVEVDVGRQGQPPPSCRALVTTPRPEQAATEGKCVDGIAHSVSLATGPAKPGTAPVAAVEIQQSALTQSSPTQPPMPTPLVSVIAADMTPVAAAAPGLAPSAVLPTKFRSTVLAVTSAAPGSAVESTGISMTPGDDDEELEALLMGRRPARLTQTIALPVPTAATVAAGTVTHSAWPAIPPALSGMVAARFPATPAETASRTPQAQLHAVVSALSAEGARGQTGSAVHLAANAGQVLVPGPGVASSSASSSHAGSESNPFSTALQPSIQLARQVAVPAASPGATASAARVTPVGLPGLPANMTRPSPGIAAGPAAIGGSVVRLAGQTVLAPAGSRGVLGSQASGQFTIAGQSTAPPRAPAAVAGAGGGNIGGHENVIMDDDLRLLLGLQVAGSGSANAGPEAATVQPSMQVSSRVGLKTTPVTRPPAGGRAAPQQSQQPPAEDLDDWLKSL
ncbi:hypothetical protein VaNZ11_000516 [Volvox africanus]|uniref:Uncharacterized protein n=1 Tax=Volvox africanus TaxID=51714 RepID=A0ABQ5RN63_9CHLO|nr:hypothetical protein VaNZ11_000516 [Volvox africanus]